MFQFSTSLSAGVLTLSMPMLLPPYSDLPRAIENLDTSSLVPFPQFDGSRFRELLDEEMGFSHSRESSASGVGR